MYVLALYMLCIKVDVLPSKNQALCNFKPLLITQCIVIVINDVTGKSHEQRLINIDI